MLLSLEYTKRRYIPVVDPQGVAHHATRLNKKELQYIFRLADTVTAITPCEGCGAEAGKACTRKRDRAPMSNHSLRVRQAKLLFNQRILPKLGLLYLTLCPEDTGPHLLLYKLTDELTVDCMTCLVVAAKRF